VTIYLYSFFRLFLVTFQDRCVIILTTNVKINIYIFYEMADNQNSLTGGADNQQKEIKKSHAPRLLARAIYVCVRKQEEQKKKE